MGASASCPGFTVGRGPQANALTTATSYQVPREPHSQFLVVNHDRIAVVGLVAAGKRWWRNFGEGGAIVGGVRRTRVVVAVVVVVIDDDGVVSSLGAVEHHAFALGASAARGAATIADKNVWGNRRIAVYCISRAGGVRPGYYAALHE